MLQYSLIQFVRMLLLVLSQFLLSNVIAYDRENVVKCDKTSNMSSTITNCKEGKFEGNERRQSKWGDEEVLQFLPFELPENPFVGNKFEAQKEETKVAGFVHFINKVMKGIQR